MPRSQPVDHDLHGVRLDYQPIVDLDTRRTASFEALVRWNHPQLGPISAPELIDVAESTGLIVALGARLLLDACSAAARWQQLPAGADINVAVNVSAMQLVDDGFAATVEHALEVSGLPPNQLCLELTETRLLTAGPRAIDTIECVGALGVNLMLDNFGTGYSSLSHLADLPVRVLKVDRAFVLALDTADTSRASVARAVIGLATALELDTVAAGVETEQQANTVHDLGSRLAQGYYFSRPVRETALRPLLSEPLPV